MRLCLAKTRSRVVPCSAMPQSVQSLLAGASQGDDLGGRSRGPGRIRDGTRSVRGTSSSIRVTVGMCLRQAVQVHSQVTLSRVVLEMTPKKTCVLVRKKRHRMDRGGRRTLIQSERTYINASVPPISEITKSNSGAGLGGAPRGPVL